MYRSIILFALAFATLSIGCHQGKTDLSNRKARVVATTGMIADAVKQIGGDRVELICLMGPGVDPHSYNPKPSDLTNLQKADLILHNGLHLEGQMDDVFERLGNRIRTCAVTKNIPHDQIRKADESIQGGHDPHVWFDVQLWKKAVECVRDELVDLDPKNADYFRENAERYLAELQTLDAFVREQTSRLSPQKRVLITCHDAFGYFGDAYGYEVRGLQGVSTEGQVGITERTSLAKVIVQKQIPVIFGETSVPDSGIEALQESVRMLKGSVRLSEKKLFSDALGEPGTPAETYVGMVRHNITTIVEELSK